MLLLEIRNSKGKKIVQDQNKNLNKRLELILK